VCVVELSALAKRRSYVDRLESDLTCTKLCCSVKRLYREGQNPKLVMLSCQPRQFKIPNREAHVEASFDPIDKGPFFNLRHNSYLWEPSATGLRLCSGKGSVSFAILSTKNNERFCLPQFQAHFSFQIVYSEVTLCIALK
jgi:hypothetical protein